MTDSAPTMPLDARGDKPRIVAAYDGVQLIDARDFIRIHVTGEMPTGLRGGLKAGGFKPYGNSKDIWQRKMSPAAIMEAEAIVNVFFREEP